MNRENILWITSHLRECNDKEYSWLPNKGQLAANIVLLDENLLNLTKTILAVRAIRVGSEARFPQIIILAKPDSLKEELLNEISNIDTTTPRIKLIVALNCSDKMRAVEYINLVEAIESKHLIDTSLLYLSFGGEPTIVQELFKHTFRHKVFYEWYPDHSTSSLKNTICYCSLAYKELEAVDYDYAEHPLSLCGGISRISRQILTAKFNNNLKTMHFKTHQKSHEVMQYLGAFNHVQPNCALGALAYLFGKQNIVTRFSCTCTSTMELPQQITQFYLAKKNNKEHRLFEDWQYIYDGFDYV